MSKHICPWCGERSLTTFQKTSRRVYDSGVGKVKNRICFTCPSCKNEIDHIMKPEGKKYESVLMICILVFLALLLVFTALDLRTLILVDVALLIISALLLILVHNKFTEFVKHETGD